MKKEGLLLIVLPIVMVFIGLFAGFYFGVYKTAVAVAGCQMEKALIAPSPVISQSLYDEKKHQLKLTIVNPGGMPIELLDKSLVLKPANAKRQPVLIMSSIPLNIVLPPYSTMELDLKLGNTTGFVVGDVLETTLTYMLPVSNDVYAVVHRFEKSSEVNSQGYVKNALGDNSQKTNQYDKMVKEKSKK